MFRFLRHKNANIYTHWHFTLLTRKFQSDKSIFNCKNLSFLTKHLAKNHVTHYDKYNNLSHVQKGDSYGKMAKITLSAESAAWQKR